MVIDQSLVHSFLKAPIFKEKITIKVHTNPCVAQCVLDVTNAFCAIVSWLEVLAHLVQSLVRSWNFTRNQLNLATLGLQLQTITNSSDFLLQYPSVRKWSLPK